MQLTTIVDRLDHIRQTFGRKTCLFAIFIADAQFDDDLLASLQGDLGAHFIDLKHQFGRIDRMDHGGRLRHQLTNFIPLQMTDKMKFRTIIGNFFRQLFALGDVFLYIILTKIAQSRHLERRTNRTDGLLFAYTNERQIFAPTPRAHTCFCNSRFDEIKIGFD